MSQTAAPNQRVAPTTSTVDVQLCQVYKVFGSDTAVRGVDLSIRRGEFFSILGPSGCGKTTTLRLIAGFEEPTAGSIFIRGESTAHVPPYRRPVNTVFQSYALFDHMTVWDNIAFGLRIQRQSRALINDRVGEALRLVKMEAFARRYPTQLSGGQQQRVALARALVNRPAVVLLDEPLGALDLKLRKEMQVELSTLHQQLGVTFVMVTHDQEEALSLSDRIAVMHEGRIEQIGTPSEIYDFPKSPFVADFIGDTNLFRGRIERLDGSAAEAPQAIAQASTHKVVTEQGLTIFVRSPDAWDATESPRQVVVSVRPEKIQVGLGHPAAAANCFTGWLKNIMYLGTHVHYVVELQSGDQLKIMRPSQSGDRPQLHTPLYAYWNEADCLVLAA